MPQDNFFKSFFDKDKPGSNDSCPMCFPWDKEKFERYQKETKEFLAQILQVSPELIDQFIDDARRNVEGVSEEVKKASKETFDQIKKDVEGVMEGVVKPEGVWNEESNPEKTPEVSSNPKSTNDSVPETEHAVAHTFRYYEAKAQYEQFIYWKVLAKSISLALHNVNNNISEMFIIKGHDKSEFEVDILEENVEVLDDSLDDLIRLCRRIAVISPDLAKEQNGANDVYTKVLEVLYYRTTLDALISMLDKGLIVQLTNACDEAEKELSKK